MALTPAFFGYNYAFWLLISATRFTVEHVLPHLKPRRPASSVDARPAVQRITPSQVAVIMAAHNEETALPATLTALKKNLPAENIYLGSDASTDRTAAIARQYGCHVVELTPNRGKAKVLAHLLRHYRLLEHYRAVLIMDAEVVVSDSYLEKIMPYFDDPHVVAFVAHSISRWQQHWLPRWSMFFTAYRIRLWLTLYYGLRYGQTWKYMSLTPIIPGGSSVYRSSALARIDIDTPGLIIEDFHMTFQVHHKKLGRIASHPSAYIIDQEPYNLRDYCRQVSRWFLGFWQTYFYHGYWPSAFWLATTLFTAEMLLYALVILSAPFILAAMVLTPFDSFVLFHLTLTPLHLIRYPITVQSLLIGLLAADYGITMLTAWIEGKPALFLYGLGFFLLRYIDTFIFLWTLPLALLTRGSSGTWRSPRRLSPTTA